MLFDQVFEFKRQCKVADPLSRASDTRHEHFNYDDPNSQVRVRHLPDKFHFSGRDK